MRPLALGLLFLFRAITGQSLHTDSGDQSASTTPTIRDAPPNPNFLMVDRHFRQGGMLFAKFFNYVLNKLPKGYLMTSREYIDLLDDRSFLKHIWSIKLREDPKFLVIFQRFNLLQCVHLYSSELRG